MSSDHGVLRAISWRDVCPWLVIFRTFRIAIAPSILLLAVIAALLTPLGWCMSAWLFVSEDELQKKVAAEVEERDKVIAQEIERSVSDPQYEPDPQVAATHTPSQVYSDIVAQNKSLPHEWPRPDWKQPTSLVDVWHDRFVQPFRQILETKTTFVQLAYYLFGGLWVLAVWAFFGGAITRIAVVKLGRDERVGLKDAIRYTCQRYFTYFRAPLYPMIVLVAFALAMMLLGLLMKLNIGVLVAGIAWIVVLLLALIVVRLLFGLLLGWPLMWPSISAEGSDVFESLTQAYDYPVKRILPYLFYVAVAVLFGAAGWWLVSTFLEAVIHVSHWGVSWGTGNARLEEILEDSEGGGLRAGRWLLNFWANAVRTIGGAFVYSFFWCAVSAIYLIMRYEVDHKEFDEGFVDEQQQYELPDAKQDDADQRLADDKQEDEPETDDGDTGGKAEEPEDQDDG